MPGWSSSTRKQTLPPNWAALRRRVLARDGGQCTWDEHGERCTKAATDVDHIVRGEDHSLSNLRSLCSPHHRRKSSGEGGRAKAKRQTKRTRAAERHPGLIAKRPRIKRKTTKDTER